MQGQGHVHHTFPSNECTVQHTTLARGELRAVAHQCAPLLGGLRQYRELLAFLFLESEIEPPSSGLLAPWLAAGENLEII